MIICLNILLRELRAAVLAVVLLEELRAGHLELILRELYLDGISVVVRMLGVLREDLSNFLLVVHFKYVGELLSAKFKFII